MVEQQTKGRIWKKKSAKKHFKKAEKKNSLNIFSCSANTGNRTFEIDCKKCRDRDVFSSCVWNAWGMTLA